MEICAPLSKSKCGGSENKFTIFHATTIFLQVIIQNIIQKKYKYIDIERFLEAKKWENSG